jgi:small subunit ribosomal protein S20
MAHHKACVKHERASVKRMARNRAAKSRLRTAIKHVRQAKDKTEAAAALQTAFSVIDKSAKGGIIHRNNAANKKAKLSRAVQKMA